MSALRWGVLAGMAALTACASGRVPLGSAVIPPQGGFERTVTARSCGMQLMYLIPIMLNSRHERAYANLQAQAGKDLLTAVEVQESWSYAFVGTVYCSTLRARAVAPYPPKAVAPPPEAAPAPPQEAPPAAPPEMPEPAAAPTDVPPIPAATPAAEPVPVAPPPPPQPPQPAALARGGKAKLKAGGVARARATGDGAPVAAIEPGAELTLKVDVNNASGLWWYVTGPGGSGWVLASELEPVGP